MTESYSVEATLEWKTNVPTILKEMLSGFERVNQAVAGLKDGLGELGSGSRGIGGIVRQLDKLKVPTAALDGLREMTEVSRRLAEAQGNLARDALETARAWKDMAMASHDIRMPRAMGAPGAARGGHSGVSHASLTDAAMGAQMFGDAGMNLAERGFHAYADVQLQQTMAQSDKRVTDAVLGRANALVASLQKQYPALTQSEGMLLFRNSMGIFGDGDEALKALPGAARLQQFYQLAPLGKGGTGGSEVQAAEKAGDALQAFIDPKTQKLDTGLYAKWMDFQARSYQAGGGLIDAKAWLAFARTSRSAGIGLSPRAMEEAQALLEMSPGRTGTALMSAFQVFGSSTAHMTNKNKAEWSKAGLLGKSGDIIDRSLYQADPFEWVWKDMLPALQKRGITTRDQILAWLTKNGQRGTVSGLLADIAIGRTPITNTATKMEAQDPNLVDKLVNTDTGKLAALHAAETNFLVALGKFGEGPGLALLTKLTDALNKLVATAEAHPDAAKRLISVGLGLALISKVAGDAGMAAIFVGGPLVKGIGGLASALSPFGRGAAAGEALSALTAASGAGSLFGLGAAIAALGGILAGMAWLAKPPEGSRFVGNGLGGGKGGHWEHQGPDGQWTASPPPKGVTESWWDHFRDAPGPVPGMNSHRGSLPMMAPTPAPDVHITVPLVVDGKTIAKATMKYQNGQVIPGAATGTTGFDNSMHPYPAAVPTGGH